MASDRKNLSRRHLLSIAGGAAGLLAAGTAKAVDMGEQAGPQKKPSDRVAPGSPENVDPGPDPARCQTEQVPAGPKMREHTVPAASEAALAALGGVRVGDRIGAWKLVAIHDFHLGAVPVVLEDGRGERFQVDVLRRDTREGAPRGIAETRHLSLFLSNKGNGATPSSERQGLGVMALAAAIRKREAFGSAPGLLTLGERAAQFPGAGYRVPV